jgi:hypothetical protein
MNINTFTSLLFIIPFFYAKTHGINDVAYACISCLATSVIHHYHECNVPILGYIDRMCVRAIGGFYVYKSLTTKDFNIFSALTLWWSAFTVYLYIAITDYRFYWFVHVCANVGIICYIKSLLIVK